MFCGELRRTLTIRHRRYGSVSRTTSVKQVVGLLVRLGRARDSAAVVLILRSVIVAGSGAIVVVLAGLPVIVRVQVVGVARGPVQFRLGRLLGTEARAIIEVFLRQGWSSRVCQLLPSYPSGEAASKHEGDN